MVSLPFSITAYVGRRRAHGYWRNAHVGLPFAYSDVPALVPVLVGEHTRSALSAAIAVHVRGDTVETTTHARDDDRVIADHLAVHRAVADDRDALLAAWRRAADQLGGVVESAWPPVLAIPRLHGPATIALRWSDSLAIGSEAAIELVAHAHGSPLWSLRREPVMAPNCIAIGDHPFLVLGPLPMPLAELASIIAATDIVSITVRRHATIRIARGTPDIERLMLLLRLLDALCAGADPYR